MQLKKITSTILENKKIAVDFCFTAGATALIYAALNIIIYPIITYYSGKDLVGEILYFTGIIYILPQAIGSAINNARLIIRKTENTSNSDYTQTITVLCVFSALVCGGFGFLDSHDPIFTLLYALFSIVYALRIYAQVEFRLKLKFSGFFKYNAIVCVGYIIGFGFYLLYGQWLFIFLTGETLAIIYSVLFCDIFKKETKIGTSKLINKTVAMLMLTLFIRDAISQFDRIIIRQIIGTGAVTEYHVVSLFAKTAHFLTGPIVTLLLSYLTVPGTVLSRKQFKKIIFYVTCFCVVFYIVCIIGTPVYIKLFYSNLYDQVIRYNIAVNIFIIMGFISNIFTAILQSHGKVKEHTILRIIWGVVYVGLSYIFAAKYAIWGIILATAISNTMNLIAVIGVTYKCLPKTEKCSSINHTSKNDSGSC